MFSAFLVPVIARPASTPLPNRDLRPHLSGVTPLVPVPPSVPLFETQVDDVRRIGEETDVHRQGTGRPIEGRVPWV
jgi:hypothetical protein